jgi:hypothetical protein
MAKPKTKVPQHNYIRKLHYMYRIGAIPQTVGIHQVDVFHDDYCRLINGQGHCNCNPDVKLRWSQPDASKN